MSKNLMLLPLVPPVALFGAAALVQGVIFWRTDYEANARTDVWMQADSRKFASEILANRLGKV